MRRDRLTHPPPDPSVTRRHLLALFGAGAVAVGLGTVLAERAGLVPDASAMATQGAVCLLSAEVTQGPYYLQHQLVRQDITEGKAGFPLNLTMTVVDHTNGCAPLADRPVEIWHCDAWGYYSGFTTTSPGGSVPAYDGVGDPETFLRGIRVTDANGRVTFTSIVPGWYSPRVTHIHVKVHQGGDIGTTYENGSTLHTTQLLFPDDVVQAYSVLEPYAQHRLELTRLVDDQVYNEALSAGEDPTTMVPTVTPIDTASVAAGYNVSITLGIDPSATSSDTAGPAGPGGPAGGQPPGGAPPPGPPPVQLPAGGRPDP
jgi:protocatechuate 3,4-dioxygenase beta subunit